MELKQKAYLTLIFSMVWAALLPILLTAGRGAGINEFFMVAYASSVPASLLVIAIRGKMDELKSTLRDWKKIAIIGSIGIVTFFPIEYGITMAEQYVTASLASVIIRTSPLLMLILLPTILHEKLTKYQIVALGLGFIGLYIGVSGGNLLGVFQNANANVVLFLVFMAFIYAFSIVLMKKYMYDISIVLFISGIVMFILVSAMYVYEGALPYSLNAFQIAIALSVGVFFNAINFFIYFWALRPLKATITTNIMAFSPFITFGFADLLLGEQIKIYYIAIAVLAFAGIAIQSFDKVGGRYIQHKRKNEAHISMFDVTGVFANTGEAGINAAIKSGGRILAVKLGSEHAAHLDAMALEGNASAVYTDSHEAIREESRFVKDVVGARDGEFVVMKAGKLDECEAFFDDLFGRIRNQ